ncbi:MAG TPA: response regulator [Spirochaetia bacterium]|jgi:DNA-binding NarL/FixJ family response regulator|nr:response regulator [Spirochaetia bacterium]
MPSRILIVEDEPLVALDLKETLQDAGYRVIATIDSADTLLGAYREHSPDLVLMDIRLKSFLDGIDAVTRLRFLSTVPVIFTTAYSNPDVVRRAEGTKPAAFLVKPVDGPVLVDAVRHALAAAH